MCGAEALTASTAPGPLWDMPQLTKLPGAPAPTPGLLHRVPPLPLWAGSILTSPHLSIVDRREAIRTAVMMAEKGDVILIAGKGHEDYQDVKGTKHHFDDREEVRKAFGA